MRILWITNSLFEEYFVSKGKHAAFTGGWMRSLALKLREMYPDIELGIASRLKEVRQLEELKSGDFTFFALPGDLYQNSYDSSIESDWKEVNKRFNPDVIHIHGSEFPHGLAYVKANGSNNVLVSLQGIVSRYARYNSGGVSNSQFVKNLTFYDLFISSTPFADKTKYKKLGLLEEKLLKSVKYIVGRTSWDKVHAWAINPDATYHFCNETLRKEFYTPNNWELSSCQPHRIFLSQAAKPIKGIHKVIEALPLILRKHPDTEVYVAGHDFTRNDNLHSKLRYSTYAKYVNNLMHELGVKDKIHFLGMLDAEQMAEQLRLANVFVCPSSIENSPNSLGEAQLIGCPVVASYVGGVPDMVEDGKTGLLYRFEETEMLAYSVCRIFDDKDLSIRISNNGKNAAELRHEGNKNATDMMNIYKEILSGK